MWRWRERREEAMGGLRWSWRRGMLPRQEATNQEPAHAMMREARSRVSLRVSEGNMGHGMADAAESSREGAHLDLMRTTSGPPRARHACALQASLQKPWPLSTSRVQVPKGTLWPRRESGPNQKGPKTYKYKCVTGVTEKWRGS